MLYNMYNLETKMTNKTALPATAIARLRTRCYRAIVLCKAGLHQLKKYCNRRNFLYIAGGSLVLFGVAYAVAFFVPRNVNFSYSSTTCFTNPVVLPRLVTKKANATYRAVPQTAVTILGYPVYAQTTCLTPEQAPQQNTTQTFKLGNRFFSKRLRVVTGKQPTATDLGILDRPIPTKDPLVLTLDRPDTLFDYQLSVNNQEAACSKHERKISCDTPQLGLVQSSSYSFILRRSFKGKPVSTVFARTLSTVEAVHVASTSIAAEALVYTAPTELTLATDKPVKEVKDVKLVLVSGNTRSEIPVSTKASDKSITLTFGEALPRSSNFEISVGDIISPDGGYLLAPFVLPFTTSGGPKVLSVNIGSSRVQPGSAVSLTFDTAPNTAQAIGNFLRIEANGAAVPLVATAKGKTVTLKPQSVLPRCATLTVRVVDGLQNEYGISGASAWQFKSRVLCQAVFSIGTSVQGRAITAYSFGSGPSKVIFVGGTHGNEKSSVYILNKWIDTLESNPGRIPANRTIIVIPNLNPDGYATNSRTNAHNVDLNRNFPSNSWKAGVTMPDKSYLEYGGGTAPLSEPESRALANYVQSQNPRLVLTYHAAGGVVVPNDSGDSDALAHTYDRNSKVGYMPNSGTATFFEYDTTGAFEDWLHDKAGITALLIELLSKTDNEYSGHQNALWLMAQS